MIEPGLMNISEFCALFKLGFVKEFLSLHRFNYNHMFPSPALQSDAVKISTFLRNDLDKQLARSLCINFMHCVNL